MVGYQIENKNTLLLILLLICHDFSRGLATLVGGEMDGNNSLPKSFSSLAGLFVVSCGGGKLPVPVVVFVFNSANN
jgi:hypothetical protein